MLNDENIINLLRQVNLLGYNNYYFVGKVVPSVGNQILFGVFSQFIKDFSGYIINQNENGIGLIPVNNMTGKPMLDLVYFLPKNNIAKVEVKNCFIFYKKITIIDMQGQSICFNVARKEFGIKMHRPNVDFFLSIYHS